jgi:hypothetical protein
MSTDQQIMNNFCELLRENSTLKEQVRSLRGITAAPDNEVTRLRERVAELEWALEGIFELAYSSRLDTALDLARAIYHKHHQHP